MQELYRQGRRAAIWAIGISVALGIAKLAGGLLGHSVALVSDAVHSLGDALTAGAVFAALLWSQQPADREHPYGHTRAEAVAGSNVSLLLILSAVWVGWESIATLAEHSPEPEPYTLVIAAGSFVLMECLCRYETWVAQRTGSSSLRATAWDHRLDAFGSLAVLAGLGLAKGLGWHAADHVAALVVALIIFSAGVHLFWVSFQELMDRQAEPEVLHQVRQEAAAVPGVVRVEKLLVRKSGLEYLVDIHVEVNADITVREGHAIAHAVKDRLVDHLAQVKDVLVHIEPAA